MSTKYLTVLAGSPRGGELTWQSLYRNVLNPLNSDLAICTGNKWLDSQSFIKRANYLWNFEEPEDWFQYYRENFQGNWEEYFNLGKNTGLYNSGSIHFALKDIVLRNHLKVLMKYDTIIYTRFDQFYIDEHPHLDNSNIWIPEGEDYFGICDRHSVVPTHKIEEFLDICSYINKPEALNVDSDYLNSLNSDNSIFLEIISFIVIFLSTYIIYSLIEKALNLKSPSQLEFKILDIIIGALYGAFLFSIIFYFSYIAFLKNHIEERNMLMRYNISIYQNLMYKDIEIEDIQDNKSSKENKDNEKDKLY